VIENVETGGQALAEIEMSEGCRKTQPWPKGAQILAAEILISTTPMAMIG
jgi:hypothetical protein